jgi:hypothetical protein
MLTKFLKDVISEAPKVVSLPRLVRIGPKHMKTFPAHTAYNTAAFSVTSIMLFLANRFVSPSEMIPLTASLLSSMLAIVFFLVIGFVVNLSAPGELGNIEVIEGNSVSESNKWARYLILNFIVLIGFYLVVSMGIWLVTEGEESIVSLIVRYFSASSHLAAFLAVMITAVVASAVVHTQFYFGKKVIDGAGPSAMCFFISALVTGGLFYIFNFRLFI